LLILTAVNIHAQDANPLPDTVRKVSDQVPYIENQRSIPVYVNQIDTTIAKSVSPTGALFKSMFVPGWGQLSNKKYLKAGVIITLEAMLIYNIVRYSDKTTRAEDDYKSADVDQKAILFNRFQDYEDLRNLNSWYLGTLVFLSMFDAFVDAHLANFPKKNEGFSLEFLPPGEKNIAVRLSYSF